MSAARRVLSALVVLTWNRACRVGTAVEVQCDNGILFATRTRTAAWLLGDGTPVVGLEGMRAGIALDRVRRVDGAPIGGA